MYFPFMYYLPAKEKKRMGRLRAEERRCHTLKRGYKNLCINLLSWRYIVLTNKISWVPVRITSHIKGIEEFQYTICSTVICNLKYRFVK